MFRYFFTPFILLIFSATFAFGQESSAVIDPAPPVENAGFVYGIVVDNSGSFRLALERAVRILSPVVAANQAGEGAFLVTFAGPEKIRLEQETTFDSRELADIVENMYARPGSGSMLDAVKLAAEHLLSKLGEDAAGPRSLIVATDGDTRASVAKLEDVIKLLNDSRIRLFVVGIADEKVDADVIDKLAKGTGGRQYVPATSADFSKVSEELARDIRAN